MNYQKKAWRLPEAAQVSGLSVRELYKRIAAGELASFKIGGSRLIADEDLDALIQAARSRGVAMARPKGAAAVNAARAAKATASA